MSEFWINFWPNFLSDFVVGAIILTMIALWLKNQEKEEEAREVELAKIKKTIGYLMFIKSEIVELMKELPQRRANFATTGWGILFRIETYFWEALEPGGELPQLIEPKLLLTLVTFYDHLKFARYSMDKLVDSWLVPNPRSVPGIQSKTDAFVNMTLSGIDKALEVGKGLPSHIDSEVEKLNQKMKDLTLEGQSTDARALVITWATKAKTSLQKWVDSLWEWGQSL